MGDHEQDGVQGAEKKDKQAEIPDAVEEEEADFQDGMLDLVVEEVVNAIVFQDEGFEHG